MNMPAEHKKGEKMSSFYTQANLVIDQASTEALFELKKMLGEGFRNNAEITEILFEDEPHPQINMIIYEKNSYYSINKLCFQ